jgi:hypothetical protein
VTKSRITLIALAAAMLAAVSAYAQTDFQYQAYAIPFNLNMTLAAPNDVVADFNGDGLADVLGAVAATNNSNVCGATCLYLWMNNGNGLNAPVELQISLQTEANVETQNLVAIADLNGDGHLDIAALDSGNGITILYGNGDGTFQAPVSISLPSEQYTALATGDFDGNGTTDLVALDQHGHVLLLFNDGKGNFTQQRIWEDQGLPSGYLDQDLVVGDFNADGRPDIAWVEQSSPNSQVTIWTALNTGNGTFTAPAQLGTLPAGYGYIRGADLDLDGKTDLIGWTTQISQYTMTPLPVTVYYSNGDGTFTADTIANTVVSDVGVSDINGDGNRDVLIASQNGVDVYTGNGDRSFTYQGQYTALPGGATQVGFGFFDTSNRMGFAAPNYTARSQNLPSDFYVVTNNNAQGDCPYPTSAGVTFCQATGSGNSVQVRGTARAQTAPVERIELWANGQKLYQVFADEFSATLNVPANTAISAVEVEANGTTRSTTVTPSQNSCHAPGSPGVTVCAPTQGENVNSPVEFTAAGTGASGTVDHLELWIDGTKMGNYPGASMDAKVQEPQGSHTATVIEVDSNWNYVKSAPVTYTVGGASGGCAAPGSPGVNVCSPAQGATVGSPVTFTAAGTGASGTVDHLELWIDGTKIGNYPGASMNAPVQEPSGTHTASVVEVDSNWNYVKSAPVTFTVGTSGPCAAPGSPGVNVCSPSQGATVGSPVTFTAAGTGASGTVDHLELWIDGTKIGNYPGSSMSAQVQEPSGSHTASVVEVDSTWNYVKSAPVTYTVQ